MVQMRNETGETPSKAEQLMKLLKQNGIFVDNANKSVLMKVNVNVKLIK